MIKKININLSDINMPGGPRVKLNVNIALGKLIYEDCFIYISEIPGQQQKKQIAYERQLTQI